MRVTLNLATKPWVDTGTQVRRLRIALGVLLGIIFLCLLGLHFESSAAQKAQHKRDAMDAQQSRLARERHQYEAELQLPKNQAILERSQFLNSVFAEKSFSWTSVMMDLENVLPSGVQVASLDPQVMADGGIVIRLRVRGDRDRAVELVRNLERSKHFRSPRLAAEATESQQGGANAQQVSLDANVPVVFEILSDYNSVAPETKTTVTTTTHSTTTTKVKKSTISPKAAHKKQGAPLTVPFGAAPAGATSPRKPGGR